MENIQFNPNMNSLVRGERDPNCIYGMFYGRMNQTEPDLMTSHTGSQGGERTLLRTLRPLIERLTMVDNR
jgi:hypothetical protein